MLQVYWVQPLVELGYGGDEGRNSERTLKSRSIFVSQHRNVIFQSEKHYHFPHGRKLQSREFKLNRRRELRDGENFSETLQTSSLENK
jgi:hypothetical protein